MIKVGASLATLVGSFVTGALGLMPMNIFLMFGVPGLTVIFIWMLVYFGPRYRSRRPISELPFQPSYAAAAPKS